MAGPRFIHRLCAVSLSCLRGFPAGNVETWLRRTSESTAYVGEAGRPLEADSLSRARAGFLLQIEDLEKESQTVDKPKSTVIFHKEKRIIMSNI